MKKWHLDRIISIATLLTSVIALYLVLKKPAPVSQPQAPAVAAANAQSFQEKIQQLDTPKDPGAAPAEVRLTSEEVTRRSHRQRAPSPFPPSRPSAPPRLMPRSPPVPPK